MEVGFAKKKEESEPTVRIAERFDSRREWFESLRMGTAPTKTRLKCVPLSSLLPQTTHIAFLRSADIDRSSSSGHGDHTV